jgi:hypothetical protein
MNASVALLPGLWEGANRCKIATMSRIFVCKEESRKAMAGPTHQGELFAVGSTAILTLPDCGRHAEGGRFRAN